MDIRQPYGNTLIKEGERFLFLGLRPGNIDSTTFLMGRELKIPARLITILSISVGGKLTFRIDIAHSEADFLRLLGNEAPRDHPCIASLRDTLDSTYLHIAEKLLADKVWYSIEDLALYKTNHDSNINWWINAERS